MKPVHFGTWISSGSPVIAELAARCGLDWLLLDMEHGAMTEGDLLHLLRATTGVFTVVRVPTHDAGMIGRVLDAGADAIMVPHVESAQAARALVAAMRWAPEGRRGFSRSVRAHGYGLAPQKTQPLLFAQIETAKGLEQVDGIAQVPGVDILFVGPADLQLSLSNTPGAPDYNTALNQVSAAATLHNKETGILIRDQGEISPLISQRFTRIAIDSDLALLRKGFLAIAEQR